MDEFLKIYWRLWRHCKYNKCFVIRWFHSELCREDHRVLLIQQFLDTLYFRNGRLLIIDFFDGNWVTTSQLWKRLEFMIKIKNTYVDNFLWVTKPNPESTLTTNIYLLQILYKISSSCFHAITSFDNNDVYLLANMWNIFPHMAGNQWNLSTCDLNLAEQFCLCRST